MSIRKSILAVFVLLSAVFLLAVAHADEFHLPESLKYIDDEAFSGTAVSKVSLSDSLIHVGNNAFAFTENLENIQMLAKLDNDSFMEKRLSCGYLMSDDLYALGEEIWNKVSQK